MVALLVLVSHLESKADGKEPPEPRRALSDFFRSYEKGAITRLELYYIHWDSLTRFTISQDYIRKTHHDFKVIVMQPRLESMIEALKNARWKKGSGKPPDIRLGCAAFAGDKEVLSLYWGRNWPLFVMNGALYESDLALLMTVIPFLPHRIYLEVAEAIQQP
ncbi:MAG: hypothetical protein JXR96_22265 [Deltaproteobacteria bacterium]|nr:hypothetical protein [Deltaproteobacteria bacterium]